MCANHSSFLGLPIYGHDTSKPDDLIKLYQRELIKSYELGQRVLPNEILSYLIYLDSKIDVYFFWVNEDEQDYILKSEKEIVETISDINKILNDSELTYFIEEYNEA